MRIPKTNRRRALIIVDVQTGFINDTNQQIVPAIASLIKTVPYDMYAAAVFYAGKDSLWDKQQDWQMPEGSRPELLPEIAEVLKDHNPLLIQKETRSAFKGDVDVAAALKQAGIEEAHVVGTATHDCVLATAFEAFDLGFPVYVLEECCQAMNHPDRHDMGVVMLRNQNMTNNSCLAETEDVRI